MLATSAWPARAQQWIQIPVCGGPLPANVNPSAATIAVNPSGQLCVLTGAISVTVPTPTVSIATPLSINIPQVGAVVSGSYADGALTSIGSIADSVYTSVGATGDVIQLLKGIFANVITPVAVSGSFTASQTGNNIALVASQQIASPSTYGVAPVGSVLGVNAFVTNQPTVVLSGSPVSVGIAAGSSPINVTGNFATTTPSPQSTNLEQVQNINIASPSTYGVAPVGSVQGVNAFVTSLPATPLGVAIAGPTPLNVTVGGIISPQGVTIAGPSPLQITLPASPLSVGIAAGSSPINVTGNFTSASPQNTNLVQIQGVTVASASTYGAAPVGSVQGVNAFVTNNVNVTTPTPLQITLPASPIGVAIVSSPVNVTGNFTTTQTGTNLVQIDGQQIASPSTYGVAPVGSVQGVNAFVTSLPGTPLNVTIGGPTPLQITLPASPISVGVANSNINVTTTPGVSPQNVTIATSPVGVTITSSPVNVTGSLSVTPASPQNTNLVQIQGVTVASASTYGAAPVGSVQGVNAFVTNNVNVTPPTPLQITLPASPIGVAIVSSPVNVTGNFTSTQTGTNLVQIDGQQIASPSTYGLAPVGSVQGVNAFVTNNVNVTPPTPLQITLPATPISVGVANSSLSVSNTPVGSPQNVTIATSPVGVTITSSPVNVTGTLSVTPASPQNTNLVQIQGVTVASASTYGVAPVGSVQGVNAFVTSLPATPLGVAIAGPSPLQITFPASPISAGITNNVAVTPPTPLQITLPASPISVGIAGPTPLNVTLNASPLNVTQVGQSGQNFNLVQWQGTAIASPSTYGVAPVGSVGAVNAFVTNNVNVTTPTPLQVTLPASPVSVGFPATPLNVTVGNASPTNINVVQWEGTSVASPSTYGVAPVGSVGAVNAFMTNGNPNGSAVQASSQPVVIASDQTPVTVNLLAGATIGGVTSNNNIIAWTATSSFVVTNAALALGATPGIIGIHQLNGAQCSPVAQGIATPQVAFLQIFDATPHATGSDVTLGTTIPKIVLPIATSASTPSMNPFLVGPPGADFAKGITVAFTTTAKGPTAVNVNLVCSFVYN